MALWWQKGSIYQIYPLSFKDSNGDGSGDLPGIESKLDYLQWLGVDAVWLSPIYPSPFADFGYDVSDYCGIHPLFGSMADFERLLARAHQLGLRVILDLVPNHTSHEHPWFKDSSSARDSSKRDWYIWRDAATGGGPPNNWLSVFGGSAWTWSESSGQYYYHAFLKEQPDLNWRNPEVRHAMYDVLRFWLEKGVDGFRVDVMWHLIKDKEFRDNPPNPDYKGERAPYYALLPVHSTDQPEVHEIVREMRRLLDSYGERVLIGEIYLPVHRLVTYYGQDNRGAHLPYNFQLIQLPWQAPQIYSAVNNYEASLPPNAWPNWVLGNHDKPRVAGRIGAAQARIAAMLLFTLRGTPTLYYGDELGMANAKLPREAFRDPSDVNRDGERTPMQWTAEDHAGFSRARPWLPLADGWRQINVETMKADPSSLLDFYHRLLELRRTEEALTVGSYEPLTCSKSSLMFRRRAADGSFAIALNLTSQPDRLHTACRGEVMFSSNDKRLGFKVQNIVELDPDEGLIIREQR